MEMKKPLSFIRRAIDDYKMIEPGDRVAVGVSGGKDSVLLLCAMATLRQFYPVPFSLYAVRIDLGFPNMNDTPVKELCEKLNVPYHCEKTQIGRVVFSERGEKNPCALCAKMRRGALAKAAVALECNKLAFAHNRDDVIETLMLNLLYEGRIGTFSPVTAWDNTGITLIRPLIYMEEKDVRYACTQNALPIVKNACPADGKTRRTAIKDLIYSLQREQKDVKQKLFGAIQRAGLDGFIRPEK